MRPHHLPGGDESPPPGSLGGWAVEDAGKFGLEFQYQASGGWAEPAMGAEASSAGAGRPCVQARLRAGTLGSGCSAPSAASVGLDKPPYLPGPVSTSEKMAGWIGPDYLEDPLTMNVLSDQ